MREMTAEKAATEIRQAYGTWKTQGGEGWMRTVEIFRRADLSLDEAAAGVRHLLRTEPTFTAAHDPARLEQTEDDRACQIPLGRDTVGLVVWG
ncbi:hypothetical protein Ait01nite_029960 [Actinoplanes italicus]|uniref:Uncharacterized protein n=1 Tax=Actinoplanes italicus TaxID=113567 RepID=A0A2T0KIU3_9ACTN|nr:hypothetical protein [Actinoplanes italicus]PRX23452.1 hypothetical protein CLV67_103200 [Actinoplanes italicus]GIE29951.1 hypothetical protein Ait01nite_029960 [Actinoplanes italicus]